jgi:signal transduction histidine kinase
MLHQFLEQNRKEILDLTEEKTKARTGSRPESDQLRLGLPLFLEYLIRVLQKSPTSVPSKQDMLQIAANHGKECLRLGYTLSHVVHAYGAMCQATTQLASLKNISITPAEFNTLNSCLDIAIASAVSEFQFRSNEDSKKREILTLGFLAHELRNALSSATIAHEMIKVGLVGAGGSTATVLEANLTRMRDLIDRSLSEVRMRSDADPLVEKFRLSDLFDQIVTTAQIDANLKKQTLIIEVDWKIEIEADRQLILSATSNLIQNAIKYTPDKGKIWLRGKSIDEKIFIEVQDECGGIETSKITSLFDPYIQTNADRSGLGLGLTITQRAIHISQGKISVQNHAKVGCTFTIEIPKILTIAD